MPLFAVFFSSCISALVTFFSAFFAQQVALKLAAYVAWMAVLAAFAISVAICMDNLLSFITVFASGGPEWLSFFWMGLGVFIPANASAVITCQGSIWIATTMYKIQKDAITNFGS